MKNLMLIAFATLIMSMGSALIACPACEAKAKEVVKAEQAVETKASPKAETVADTKAATSECCGAGCCDAGPKRASAGQLVTADFNGRSTANMKRVSEGQIVIADITASNGCSGCGGCATPAKATSTPAAKDCDGCKPAPKKPETVASN